MELNVALNKHGVTTAAVADACGVSLRAVAYWRTGRSRLSAEQAIVIETKLGIPRRELRPDLFIEAA